MSSNDHKAIAIAALNHLDSEILEQDLEFVMLRYQRHRSPFMAATSSVASIAAWRPIGAIWQVIRGAVAGGEAMCQPSSLGINAKTGIELTLRIFPSL
ncbi:MAG: hypothetical protein A2286_10650 [Gammaproteobacteria bacterium RIFOXYA12_FULL_61_12]|nr:MAG: hypothetical protein A2514_03400 [Gammaproteobacteria bacterium RIFOXYD12_FULL_61_37]OGT92961.1 MAG: hypothetical protein A2286_10650 [Gammaproteobacteria bacterium RIFOXYA12_FULL_61_12]